MTTFEKVKEIITEQLSYMWDENVEVKPESKIIDDLGADSLDFVEILMDVEDGFNIEILDEVAEKIKTVKDFVDYVEKEKECSK